MALPTVWISLPAIHLSDRVVTRDETLAEVQANFRGSPEEWARVGRLLRAVLTACGTNTRYIQMAEASASATYAAIAARTLLVEQGVAPDEVDLLVYGSIARGYLEPATANEVAVLSGLGEPLCYDVLAACAGMVMSVQEVVGRFAVDESLTTAVVATCAAVDPGRLNHDIQTAEDVGLYVAGLTVGSASTATLLSRERRFVDGAPLPAGRIVALHSRSLPQHHSLCVVPFRGPFRSEATEMFRLARVVPETCRETVRRAGWTVQDVDLWVVHQASDRVVRQIADQLGIPHAKMPGIHGEFGNCESSSVPLTLRVLHDRGVLQPGMKIVLCTAAGGFMSANVAIEWG